MLNSIFKCKNIITSTNVRQNKPYMRGMSSIAKDIIPLPPAKMRFGKTKTFLMFGSGSCLGAYAAKCMVGILESWDVYPDVADPDDY